MHNHFARGGGKANLTSEYGKSFQTVSLKKYPTTYIYRVFQQKKNIDNIEKCQCSYIYVEIPKGKIIKCKY